MGCGRKWLWSNLRHHLGIHLKGSMEKLNILIQDSQCYGLSQLAWLSSLVYFICYWMRVTISLTAHYIIRNLIESICNNIFLAFIHWWEIKTYLQNGLPAQGMVYPGLWRGLTFTVFSLVDIKDFLCYLKIIIVHKMFCILLEDSLVTVSHTWLQ